MSARLPCGVPVGDTARRIASSAPSTSVVPTGVPASPRPEPSFWINWRRPASSLRRFSNAFSSVTSSAGSAAPAGAGGVAFALPAGARAAGASPAGTPSQPM